MRAWCEKGGREARRRHPIVSTAQLPAPTTSAALASVSVTPVHTAAAGRARAYDSPDPKLTTPSTSHLLRAERASQRRARVDKRSLSPPLFLPYTLDSAAATSRPRLFIYYIRHPHTPVALFIYIHRWQSSLVSLSSLNVTNPSWFIIVETIPYRPRTLSLSLVGTHQPRHNFVGFSYRRRRRKNHSLREKSLPSAAASQQPDPSV